MKTSIVAAAAASCAALGVVASEYQDAWGPPVGSPLPAIAPPDQFGHKRDLVATLANELGLLLFAVRSADW